MPAPAKTRPTAPSSSSPSVSIAKAKANFSSIITAVQQKHDPITILRRGVPVAQIIPFPGTPVPMLRGSMAGTARILGDIVSPFADEWTLSDEDWHDK